MGYVLEEKDRPGIFHPEKAKALGVPVGPMWSSLQKGESVTLQNGERIDPSMILGDKRKGRKFSFVTDSMYFPEIAPQVANSNLLICEGMFTAELEESAKEKKHMTGAQAARIAAEAGGVESLGLIHYSPRYTEWELKTLLKEAKEIFPQTFLTKDQMVISLPNKD
jgi:ribonuclease Z